MPLIFMKRYSPEICQRNPDSFFIFGDNVARWGKQGQACVRDEPNAIGIPTKWRPGRKEEDYFSDFNYAQAHIRQAFHVIEEHLHWGCTVVFPEDGIGTGLAELPKRAPKVYLMIQEKIKEMEKI